MKKLGVLGLFPVPQITQVLDECWVVEILVLRKICAYRGIPEEEEEEEEEEDDDDDDEEEEEEDAKKKKREASTGGADQFCFFF